MTVVNASAPELRSSRCKFTAQQLFVRTGSDTAINISDLVTNHVRIAINDLARLCRAINDSQRIVSGDAIGLLNVQAGQ